MPGIGHGIGIPFAHKGFQWSTYWTARGLAAINDGSTAAWYDQSDLTTITKDGLERVSVWADKLGHTGMGANIVINSTNEADKTTVSVSRLTTTQSNEQAHGGTYSSKVVHNALVGAHYLYIPVTAGVSYTVSVWVYIPSGQANIDTITLGSGGAGDLAHTNTKDTWVQLSGVFTPGLASFSLSSGSSNSPGEYYYFDDFTIQETLVDYNLKQTTDDKKPIYSADGITFDGADDYLKTSAFPFAQPATYYLVIKKTAQDTDGYIFDGYTPNSIYINNSFASEKNYIQINGVGGLTISNYVDGYDFFILRVVVNGASSSLRINDYSEFTGNFGTSDINGFTLGARGNGTNYWSHIRVKEIILREGVDSSDDSTSIYNYLYYKYTSSLLLYGNFVAYASNPILSPTAPSTYATFSSVLKVDSIYHLYYHDYIGGSSVVNHATSSDGKTWVKDSANNPVLEKSAAVAWDDNNVGVPMVWKEGATWYMLYRGGTPAVGVDATGLATSPDGITWTKEVTNPVLEGTALEWDGAAGGGAEVWGVIKVDATYYAYYEAVHSDGTGRAIGVATSSDLVTWTKDANNPIFTYGRFCPFVFKYGELYYILVPHYAYVTDYAEIEIYSCATPTFYSDDRTYLGTVKKPGASGWDAKDQDTPVILTDDIFRNTFVASGGKLWLYYAGNETADVWYTGLLISDGL